MPPTTTGGRPARLRRPAVRNVETGRDVATSTSFADYLGFIGPRLEEARRLLTAERARCTSTSTGARRTTARCCSTTSSAGTASSTRSSGPTTTAAGQSDRWPAKHDTILVYVKTPGAHYFDQDADRRAIPYLAPGLVTPEKAARGKLPTDVWWHTIVPTDGHEKTGYPNQKPEGVLRRVLEPSSRPGDWVLDFFAGSGTTGAVAAAMGRRFVLVDANPAAVEVMRERLPATTTTYLELR